MEEKTKEVELRFEDFWDTFKRCWIVMLAALVVVSIGLYIFLSATHTDRYEAEVTIYILRNPDQESSGSSSRWIGGNPTASSNPHTTENGRHTRPARFPRIPL